MEENRIDAGDQSQVTNRSADFIFVVLQSVSPPWRCLSFLLPQALLPTLL